MTYRISLYDNDTVSYDYDSEEEAQAILDKINSVTVREEDTAPTSLTREEVVNAIVATRKVKALNMRYSFSLSENAIFEAYFEQLKKGIMQEVELKLTK